MADASTATRPTTPQAPARREVPAFNGYSVWAMYRFQMVRFFRTIGESLATPVITTALYFVVFGSAIGGRMGEVDGVSYGAFIIPGLIMMSLLNESISNASFGIYMPKWSGTIYELLSAPVSFVEVDGGGGEPGCAPDEVNVAAGLDLGITGHDGDQTQPPPSDPEEPNF